MGAKSSKGESSRRSSSFGSSSSWRNAYPQSPFGHGSPTHEQYSNPPHQDYAYGNDVVEDDERRFHRKYSRIADDYKSLEEVTEALADAGLESSNLIVGIDFTKSNEWKGARSFNRQSLHLIGDGLNPYEQAISIIGKTLAAFDEDNLIPCFGFGDATTHDQDVFNFISDEKICNGFEAVLSRYREIVPHLRLAGPTSFAPIIEMAMNIVEQSGGQYHILVIIADGQVTRADAGCGKLSPQEQKTVNAIVEASKFPLSIILVGVGDGPWDMMKEFDDNIPARDFDNFQFVNFTDIMTKDIAASQKEAAFALAALMEIPSQYKASLELNLLGGKANAPYRYPRLGRLPPPIYDSSSSNSGSSSPVGTTRRATSFSYDNKVTEALAHAGLESSNLIVGIDFTKSNEWTGARSFNRLSLHHIGDGQNPYEQAISIIGKTLAAFDEDNLIPCFGFGDATTHDQDVFSFFHPPKRFCNGFEEVLSRYREIVPHLRLAGPTSFAPIIEMAMTVVEKSGGQYHVLVIIADGQVTRSIDTDGGKLSPQEQKTVDAIVKASKFPLSIILVGVGDGPWDLMKEFDDNIPDRDFDNFHFVNFTEIMSENIPPSQMEETFAGAALMEIPSQYKSTIELNLLGNWKANAPERVPLPPPINVSVSLGSSPPSNASSSEPSLPPYCGECSPVHTAPPPTSSSYNNQLCPVCLSNSKDMAFRCGHQTCCECGQDLQCCPLCRSPIDIRIKLY